MTTFLNFPKIAHSSVAPETEELLIKLKDYSKIYKVKSTDLSVEELQKIILERPEIEWAEPNYSFQIAYIPNDPLYHEQWYLDKIQTPQAWDLTQGGSADVTVAVLDTGVDIDHPDLKNNIWLNKDETKGDGVDNDHNGYIDDINGWDFINNIPNPKPKFDEVFDVNGIHHGTLIAGIIAGIGDNLEGTSGIAFKSKIMPLRVLNSEGSGTVEHVIQAVKYAVDNGAKVINLSFVGTNKSYFLAEALKNAWQRGVIIVAAGGNETTGEPVNLNNTPNYPVCLDEDDENFIIGVAAVDSADKKASFSNYGSKCIDISAPGTRIYGPLVYNSNYENFKEYYGGYWSGTSIAAPVVSGLAALVWSVNPLLTQKQVQNFIISQADSIDSLNPNFAGQLGSGRVNAYKTIEHTYNQAGILPQSYYIVTGAGPGGGPHVRVFDLYGQSKGGFFAYAKQFTGGVNVAVGDVDGDGKDEIVTGAGPGGGPHVRVFDLYGQSKTGFFAYQSGFKGGVNVAVGDVDGDGKDEIVTSGATSNNQIRIFSFTGDLRAEFFAYQSGFKGGVNVAVGDVDGDGKDEIVTGAGPGGGPHVRVFNNRGVEQFNFFAFNKTFLGGVNVAVGDVDGDGKDEILASVASGASPYVRVFSSEFLQLRLQFLAYSREFYGGINLVTADFDGDQKAEIITGPRKGMEPQVNVFSFSSKQLSQFYAYTKQFKGGVSMAVLRTKGY
ncbi:MAG: S8 family serine peptidase [Patescibacteria group bacterium]|nr:S8 family serine peptidase [Patescibacteria group bacterium]